MIHTSADVQKLLRGSTFSRLCALKPLQAKSLVPDSEPVAADDVCLNKDEQYTAYAPREACLAIMSLYLNRKY